MTTQKITYLSATNDIIFPKESEFKPTIIAVIPAHNEEEDISTALESLAVQRLPKNVNLNVYVALDNCTDNTEEVVRSINERLGLQLFILETKDNLERKVGALNQVYQLLHGNELHLRKKNVGLNQKRYNQSIQAYLGIDADVRLEKDCLLKLWEELNSAPYIGSVSANYTCEYTKKEELQDRRPLRGFRSDWWVSQQIRDFTDWTLRQKQNKHIAEIAGGQCTLFRPQAMLDVREKFKLNGFYDNITDTEDLLITQNIRSCGWTCLISRDARCYVDSMETYGTYFAQRKKWVSGTIDYMMMTGLKTAFARRLWLQELGLLLNFIIRVLLLTLLPASVILGVFTWNWLWALPFLLSVILNIFLTLLSPNYTWVDLLLCGIGINQELYLWITLHIHLVVWVSKLSTEKTDGWAEQYSAERGDSVKVFGLLPIATLLSVLGGFYIFREKLMLNAEVMKLMRSYLTKGYSLLKIGKILISLVVIKKIIKLRHPYRP